LNFDASGKLVLKISKSEAHEKIQQNILEKNTEIRAKNYVHKIAEALAVISIDNGAEALKPIQAKISPKFQAEIDQKIIQIRLGLEGGWLQIDQNKMSSKHIKKIFDAFIEADKATNPTLVEVGAF